MYGRYVLIVSLPMSANLSDRDNTKSTPKSEIKAEIKSTPLILHQRRKAAKQKLLSLIPTPYNTNYVLYVYLSYRLNALR